MYKLRISSKAKEEIKKLSKLYQKAIIAAFIELKEDPFTGKALTRELTGKFSYKIAVYRIIYKINKKDKVVDVLAAGHRSVIYQ